MQLVGWQHSRGTQSLSDVHACEATIVPGISRVSDTVGIMTGVPVPAGTEGDGTGAVAGGVVTGTGGDTVVQPPVRTRAARMIARITERVGWRSIDLYSGYSGINLVTQNSRNVPDRFLRVQFSCVLRSESRKYENLIKIKNRNGKP